MDAGWAPEAEKVVAGLLRQFLDLRRFGEHRQVASVDASRVRQIADQVQYVVGLIVDDVEELGHLGRDPRADGSQRGGGGALDGGRGCAQLPAHQGHELGPLPRQILHGGHILNRHHHSRRAVLPGGNGGGVDEGGNLAPVGGPHDNFLGVRRLARAECLGHGKLQQRGLPSIPTEGQRLHQGLQRLARIAQDVRDATCLPVVGQGCTRGHIKDHHPQRDSVD